VGGVLLGGGALVGVAVARWLVAVVHWYTTHGNKLRYS